jgi:hypothetical protein
MFECVCDLSPERSSSDFGGVFSCIRPRSQIGFGTYGPIVVEVLSKDSGIVGAREPAVKVQCLFLRFRLFVPTFSPEGDVYMGAMLNIAIVVSQRFFISVK